MTTITPTKEQSPSSTQPLEWSTILSKLGPVIGLAFVIVFFSVLRYSTFFSIQNFELVLRQTAVVGIGALGMTLIIISGGIDLSVGSAIALVSVSIALFMPHWLDDPDTGKRYLSHGVSPWLAVLGGLGVGTLCGLITGLLITRLKLIPFIITLGMMSIIRGMSEELASNNTLNPIDTVLNNLLLPLNPRHLWMLTPGVWMMIVLAILVSAMLRYTRFGRHIFAIGSNEQTARLCGVPVERTKLLVYTLGAALTAVAGLLQFSYLTIGDPTTADGMELKIIAAVVIGGASLNGGRGTVLGSIVGALIMEVVSNGCSKMGMENSRQLIVTGCIIVLAVALDQLRHRRTA